MKKCSCEGVVRSDRHPFGPSVAYEQAQELIEHTGEVTDSYEPIIKHLNQFAHILREARFKTGSVNFETAEVRFELDADWQADRRTSSNTERCT
jgi:exoribonuclease R